MKFVRLCSVARACNRWRLKQALSRILKKIEIWISKDILKHLGRFAKPGDSGIVFVAKPSKQELKRLLRSAPLRLEDIATCDLPFVNTKKTNVSETKKNGQSPDLKTVMNCDSWCSLKPPAQSNLHCIFFTAFLRPAIKSDVLHKINVFICFLWFVPACDCDTVVTSCFVHTLCELEVTRIVAAGSAWVWIWFISLCCVFNFHQFVRCTFGSNMLDIRVQCSQLQVCLRPWLSLMTWLDDQQYYEHNAQYDGLSKQNCHRLRFWF